MKIIFSEHEIEDIRTAVEYFGRFNVLFTDRTRILLQGLIAGQTQFDLEEQFLLKNCLEEFVKHPPTELSQSRDRLVGPLEIRYNNLLGRLKSPPWLT